MSKMFETAGSRKRVAARRDELGTEKGARSGAVDSDMMKDLAGSSTSQLEKSPWTRKTKSGDRGY